MLLRSASGSLTFKDLIRVQLEDIPVYLRPTNNEPAQSADLMYCALKGVVKSSFPVSKPISVASLLYCTGKWEGIQYTVGIGFFCSFRRS